MAATFQQCYMTDADTATYQAEDAFTPGRFQREMEAETGLRVRGGRNEAKPS